MGGGTKDKLLSSFTAAACNKNVSAGPTEATVLGNIALQLLAEGRIKTVSYTHLMIMVLFSCLPLALVYKSNDNRSVLDMAYEISPLYSS